MKLNLGCGQDIRQDYVNVDFRPTDGVTVVDLSVFPWPFESASADEILMLDFLEHFPMMTTEVIISECRRILKRGASVTIQVPDAEILSAVICGGRRYPCNSCGAWCNDAVWLDDCWKCGLPVEVAEEAAIMRLFGGQDYPGNFHQTTFTKSRLDRIMSKHAFIKDAELESVHQTLNWNFCTRYLRL